VADAPTVVQLWIHGIGGSDVGKLLGGTPEDSKKLTADADEESGFWERNAPTPEGTVVQGYLWGRRGRWVLGLWLVLLPFTLVNVAGWSVASGARTSDNAFDAFRRRFAAKVARWSTAALGLALTAGWALWMVAIVGQDLVLQRAPASVRLAALLVSAGCIGVAVVITRHSSSRPAQLRERKGVWLLAALTAGLIASTQWSMPLNWMRARALLAAAAAVAAPFALAGSNRKQFEQYRARLGGTGVARERRRLGDEETLGSPCFYDHPTETAGLLLLHGLVAATVLGVVTARAFLLESPPPTALHPLLGIVGGVARADVANPHATIGHLTPFLGYALLIVGVVQGLLLGCLFLAGVLGTSRRRAGQPDSNMALAVNALRPASFAGIGVSMFTAAVGSINVLVARVLGQHIRLVSYPQLDLVPAFILGALVSVVIVAAWMIVSLVANSPNGEVPPHLGPAWRRARTLRDLVARTDHVVVLSGVVIGASLLAAAISHRGGSLALVPTAKFGGLELVAFRSLSRIGIAMLALPGLVALLAWRSREFRRAVSGLWDLLAFWPRRFHPLGVPPETERTVPEVQSHLLRILEKPDQRVQVVAHSQGTVIAFAALAGLRDRGALQRVGLVTLGSPLFVLYPRLFPAQVSPELLDELQGSLRQRWLNVWRRSDPFCVEPAAGDAVRARLRCEVAHQEGTGDNATLLGHDDYQRARVAIRHMWFQRGWLTPEPDAAPPIKSFAPRRHMVSWLDPRLLALTAYQAGVSAVFGKWADARRVGALEAPRQGVEIGPADGRAGPEVWVDFVADPGDAFDPTFAVAVALAQRTLDPLVDGVRTTLQRGDALVMGGDEVYPTASRQRYENQLIGPYALASRCVPTDDHRPKLLALPGNHDWYDGLRSFDELFQPEAAIGIWTCCQTRSYWATPLVIDEKRTGWWVWGVDLQLDNVFDRHQWSYFADVPLARDDKVILCSPIPVWAHAGDEPTAFDVLREFVEDVIDAKGARVVLHLSGDSHHYARYVRTGPDGMDVSYVTAGGGGAFTHPTHHLHETIELPTAYDLDSPTVSLRAENGELRCQPSRARSRRSLVWRNLGPRFYAQNRGFAGLLAGVAAIASYATIYGGRVADRLASPSLPHVGRLYVSSAVTLALVVLMLVGWTAFARPRPGASAVGARAVGLFHGGLQVLALVVATWFAPAVARGVHHAAADSARQVLAVTTIRPWLVGLADRVALVSSGAVLGAAAGMVVLSAYLVAANLLFGMHDNEAAGAVASTKYKHFIRIRIDTAADTAHLWVLHVPDVEQVAELFRLHDPRPRWLDGAGTTQPKVTVWDHFELEDA
jgi:hypothetical protein